MFHIGTPAGQVTSSGALNCHLFWLKTRWRKGFCPAGQVDCSISSWSFSAFDLCGGSSSILLTCPRWRPCCVSFSPHPSPCHRLNCSPSWGSAGRSGAEDYFPCPFLEELRCVPEADVRLFEVRLTSTGVPNPQEPYKRHPYTDFEDMKCSGGGGGEMSPELEAFCHLQNILEAWKEF